MGKPAGNDLVSDLLRVCEALEVRYGRRKHAPVEDVIEALVAQILELGVPEKNSREAMKRIRDEFLGWNDMRVATIREIEDILGAKYPKVRERAEDLKHLLADLYTAFRRMDIREALAGDGIETLRALPDTSNIRRDFVDRALLLALNLKVFPCDEDQIRLLKFLGGVPKQLTLQQARAKIEEALDEEGMSRLSRVLREHAALCQMAGEDEPQPISFQWDQPDPLGMDKAKPAAKSTAKVEKPTGKIEKADKPEKAEKAEKKPVTAKVEKPTGKIEKAEAKPETKSEKKPEKKAEKTEKAEKAEKAEKPEKKPEPKKPSAAKVEKSAAKPAKKDEPQKKK